MPNLKRIELLENRIQLLSVSELTLLENEIQRIKSSHSAKGLLRSGKTLHELQRVVIHIVENRKQTFMKLFKQAELDWAKSLERDLGLIIEKYFSNDLGKLQKPIDQLYQLIGNDRAADIVQTNIIREIGNIKQDVCLWIQNDLIIRKNQTKSVRVEQSQEAKPKDDIIDVKPNFMGIGLNLNALWRKFLGRNT